MIKIKTVFLQDMMARAVKGASDNKMIPITGLVGLELNKGMLIITTTDGTNTLKISRKDVEGQDCYVTVGVDIISKLVAKTTTEYIQLTIKENGLEYKGNGTYNIDVPFDEEGNIIKFPSIKFNDKAEKYTINLPVIRTILKSNKPSLALTMELPCLTGYYFDAAKVITTDTFKVCCNEVSVFPKPVLLSAEMVELLALISEDKITVQQDKGRILFTSDTVIVYGAELEGITDYPVEAVESFLHAEFESMCKLSKEKLLGLLERIELFVSKVDNSAIVITFAKDGLYINSIKSNGTELINYDESKNFQPYQLSLNIEMLKTQIACQEGDIIELWYGNDSAIKLTNGKLTQILSLLEDVSEETANGE